eukprot:TRINITY_DN10012_c0_g1_i2.p1 TRINITY_DN10012_c0_g1~~TRINITY_DN10012_c0_g1_i2.p1  ORF type:complete len:169 (-),score=12.55 TRINITY_DN10012_c0_g1_i2:93-575(-)
MSDDSQLALIESMMEEALLSRTGALLSNISTKISRRRAAREILQEDINTQFQTEVLAFLQSHEGQVQYDPDSLTAASKLDTSLLRLKLISREVFQLQRDWDINQAQLEDQNRVAQFNQREIRKRIESQLLNDPSLHNELSERLLGGHQKNDGETATGTIP